MTAPLTYAELFAGAGGLSMGLEAAGFVCAAHAEIDPHARAVLRHHWPDTRLDGDVAEIDGHDYTGVTLISGGSPCQDLSLAGRRAGLKGERSGLFYEQVRLWRESGAPYLLWENVSGALNSNNGRDFAAVLSALVGAAIAVPSDGWRSGGVAAGRDAVAAWRVLDLQHFGPPQRRTRVFVLAARNGGVDPAEVLALSEGVCRHPSPREAQEASASGARAAGVDAGGAGGAPEGSCCWNCAHGVVEAPEDEHPVDLFFTGRVQELVLRCSHPDSRYADARVDPAALCAWFEDDREQDEDIVVARMVAFGEYTIDGTASCIKQRDYKDATDLVINGRPRRLTPRECEKLMSWEPDHTRYGTREDGTVYELSDTARYQLCGNGVGSVCVQWIAERLTTAINNSMMEALHE